MGQVLDQKDERDVKDELCRDLDLTKVIDRNVGDLSGGELQRFAIAVVATQNAEIYMFDEPSSYLDVKQRLKAAQVVRSLLRPNRYKFFTHSSNLHPDNWYFHLVDKKRIYYYHYCCCFAFCIVRLK